MQMGGGWGARGWGEGGGGKGWRAGVGGRRGRGEERLTLYAMFLPVSLE